MSKCLVAVKKGVRVRVPVWLALGETGCVAVTTTVAAIVTVDLGVAVDVASSGVDIAQGAT